MPHNNQIPLARSIRAGLFYNFVVQGGTLREIDNIGDYDPYNSKDVAREKALQVAKGFSYSMDLSFSNNRGLITLKEDTSQFLRFQFNPTELTDSKEVVYESRSKTGYDNADYIWINGGPRTINFTLSLDATEGSRQRHLGLVGDTVISNDELATHNPNRGTLNQVEFLQMLQRPYMPKVESPRFIRGSAKSTNQFSAPPELIFVYGNYYLEGVLYNLETRHTLFSKILVPLRSECTVTLRIKEGRALQINSNVTKIAGQTPNFNSII